MDPLDLETAVAEGRAMFAALRAERGLDASEEVSLADVTASLMHAARAAGEDATTAAREVLDGIAAFRSEVGAPTEPLVNDRLGLNLRGRLDAVERAAVAGDARLARRELKALLKFFPR